MGALVGPRRAIRCAPRASGLLPALTCALALAVALPAPAARAEDPPKPPGLERIPGPLPTTAPDMLMLADALVRTGHVVEGRLVLRQVLEQFPDTGWQKWGYLGLGFLELARGRMEAARPYYQAAAVPGFSQDTALVVLALLDGQAGNAAQAAAILDAISRDPARRPAVQQAAAVGAGYVRYWAGDYEGAAVAFAAAADSHPDSPLADDALYGLAQSFSQLGDPESSEQVLERVNDMPAQGFDDDHVRPALRRLALREIIRATRKRYDAVPLGQPEQMLIALLDVNGRVLARGSLARLAKQENRAPAGSTLEKAAQDARAALARSRRMTHLSTDMPMGSAPTGPRAVGEVTPAGTPDDEVTPPPADPTGDRIAPRPRTDVAPDDGGGGGGLVVLLLVVGAIVLIRRRWGLPTFRRAASRPAGR